MIKFIYYGFLYAVAGLPLPFCSNVESFLALAHCSGGVNAPGAGGFGLNLFNKETRKPGN
jgi:hypothetical protein